MAVAEASISDGLSLARTVRDRAGFYGLFGILCAFTLATGDGGEIAPHLVASALFLLAAFYFTSPSNASLILDLPTVCLFLMTAYGVLQTLFLPTKIIYNGWTGTLFWFTAAVITCLARQLFKRRQAASRFRLLFIIFGTAVCILDLLEQASKTNRYFWLVPSRYQMVFGPFAYWNNFAQFVELVLPVTLWKALSGARLSVSYLLCAGIQIGAVVASGSRAGTALVLLQLIAVVALASARFRNRTIVLGAPVAVALAVIFIYAAGFQTVISKLENKDQLAVRRDINRSSLHMIRAQPLTGWGLDTYVPVYRMFALYDDGTFVNRAHNDCLQWAAEGGIPFAALMLIVAGWSIRPAIRSGWGLGVIAVSLHALVDYPFARLGVCGWYFCLLAMLSASQHNHSSRRRPL